MVKYHVQDHFDAVFVERLDQIFQFIAFMIMLHNRSITRIRCKERNRIVSPVIQDTFAVYIAHCLKLVELKNRHQFHGIYTKRQKVRNLFF